MLKALLALLQILGNLLTMWREYQLKEEGKEELAKEIKKEQDEKIQAANNIPDELPDWLFTDPENGGKK